jgi:hypothetical protein
MKHTSSVLKRRSTRHVSEITAIANEFGNSAKIIVPLKRHTWYENVIEMKSIFLVPLVLVLVLTMAPTTALATNEGSYKLGQYFGFHDYNCVTTSDCDWPNNNVSYLCAIGTGGGDAYHIAPFVTNETACVDGYISGWTSWCSQNVKVCTSAILVGNFPDMNHLLKNEGFGSSSIGVNMSRPIPSVPPVLLNNNQ